MHCYSIYTNIFNVPFLLKYLTICSAICEKVPKWSTAKLRDLIKENLYQFNWFWSHIIFILINYLCFGQNKENWVEEELIKLQSSYLFVTFVKYIWKKKMNLLARFSFEIMLSLFMPFFTPFLLVIKFKPFLKGECKRTNFCHFYWLRGRDFRKTFTYILVRASIYFSPKLIRVNLTIFILHY